MARNRLEIEFGTYALWLVEAIEALALDDPTPSATRGTGNPEIFRRLAEAIGARPGTRILDVGCGIGGPGAWLRRHWGCDVVGVDVMAPAIQGARRLFPDHVGVVASSRALPFAGDTFDGAWAIGVIETIAGKSQALREIRRVVVPGGRLGLYVWVAGTADLEDAPQADRFETLDAIVKTFEEARWTTVCLNELDDLPPPPAEWRDVIRRVRAEVRRRHTGDPLLGLIEAEQDKIRRLCVSERIHAWEFVMENGGDDD